MEEPESVRVMWRRPVLITLVVILASVVTCLEIFAVLFLPDVRFELIRLHGIALPVTTVVLDCLFLVSYRGIWCMRTWGVLLFGACSIAVPISAVFLGMSYWWNYYPAVIILLICLVYIRKMR